MAEEQHLKDAAAWIAWITWTPAIIMCCYIIKREIQSRRNHKENDLASKYLLFCSLTAMISILMLCIEILFMNIRYLCLVATYLSPPTMATYVMFFGFCQLHRLHFCFSRTQCHSNKGYPKWLFIIMYLVGIVLTIWCWIISFLYITVRNNPNHSVHGCQDEMQKEYFMAVAVAGICYIIWDLFTLFLYSYKIYQFRKVTEDENKDKISQRIQFTLNKVLLLTLSMEILAGIQCGLHVVGNIMDWIPIISILFDIICAPCMVLSTWTVYLLLEHNLKDYLYFLNLIDRFKCIYWICCCCKGIVDNAKPHIDAHNTNDIDLKAQKTITQTDLTEVPRIQSNQESIYTATNAEADYYA